MFLFIANLNTVFVVLTLKLNLTIPSGILLSLFCLLLINTTFWHGCFFKLSTQISDEQISWHTKNNFAGWHVFCLVNYNSYRRKIPVGDILRNAYNIFLRHGSINHKQCFDSIINLFTIYVHNCCLFSMVGKGL